MVVTAVGPVEARFLPSGPMRQSAVLRSAGAYTLSATFGGLLASGWPKILDVKAAYGSGICCVVKGTALNGVTCGRTASLSLSSADEFGNSRHESMIIYYACSAIKWLERNLIFHNCTSIIVYIHSL